MQRPTNKQELKVSAVKACLNILREETQHLMMSVEKLFIVLYRNRPTGEARIMESFVPSFITPGMFVNRINFDLIAIFHFHPGIRNASETSRQTLNVQSDDKMTEMRWC